jgi:hypothetical protein
MADVMKEDDEVKGKDQDIVIVEEKPEVKLGEDSDDHDEEDDSPVVKSEEGETDKEREVIRERRRLEKLERKDRRDKAISRDKLEMDFLRKRNDELERRMSAQEQRAYQADLGNLDTQLQQAQEETRMAEQVIAKAIEQGNGADVTKALGYRDQAMERVRQLNQVKQQATQRPITSEAKPDDLTMHYAKKFLDDNKWYDPQGRDEESSIVLAIDRALSGDGYNPQTEEYWNELKKRAARRLPEKFKNLPTAEKEERTPRGGPTVGSGREHAPTSTRQEVYLSPDRKQALIDAGVWDDPVLRVKYARRYAEYDKAHA